ncbi:MAG: hypothetical protein QXU40_01360 [Candidatus Pacearchaeota archaeon]
MYRTLALPPVKGQRIIRVLTGEAKQQKKDIAKYIKGEIETGVPLRIEIEIYGNWYNKDGTVKRKDLDEKLLIDAIFESLPTLDDKMIFKKVVSKIQSNETKVVFCLSKLD